MDTEIENLRIALATVRRGGEKPREISLTTSLTDLQIDVYFFGELDLNLEPLIRDAVLLALPLSPLCDPSCQGSEPEEFPVLENVANLRNDEKGDPRWAVLDRLKE